MSSESRKRMAENCISPNDEVYLAPLAQEPDPNGNYTTTLNGISYTYPYPIGAVVRKPWGEVEIYSQQETKNLWQELYGKPAYNHQ